MPQASEELRAEWHDDDHADASWRAVHFLMDAGFKFHRDWTWTAPDREITDKEFRALQYLIDEWDFGGIRHTPRT